MLDDARLVRRTQPPQTCLRRGESAARSVRDRATDVGAGSVAETSSRAMAPSYGNPLTGDGLREAPGEVVGTKGGVTGTGISDIEAEAVRPGPPSEETAFRMPNLDAMLKGDMPEVRAQIQRAAEDNPELFDAYQQGRISHDSLVADLATKVGMSPDQWRKMAIGKGLNPEEQVALQAAAIDAQARSEQLAKDIVARGGADHLTPEEVVHGLNSLVDSTRLLAVARGGRSTAGRTLNALKIRLDAVLARGITASNERISAIRDAAQAKRATARANTCSSRRRRWIPSSARRSRRTTAGRTATSNR
jgi:urease gamma subunit